jgi:hypothetical protein
MTSKCLNRYKAASSLTRLLRLIGLSITLSLASCASTSTVKQVDRLDTVRENPRILIMTPDVKYYLLTTGGLPQPHAEWTEAARINFSRSLQDYADEHSIDIVALPDANQLTNIEISYQKLYSAVGSSVLAHHFGRFKLPTKRGTFDWSLGPGVSVIGDMYGADYALFSYYRDYQASGGRVAFAILAAFVGVGMSTGGEVGFASLVDLRNGEIVWFNQVAAGAGELREQQEARATVDLLFKDIPLN